MPNMSADQLELLKVNIIASTKVFQLAGGDVSMILEEAMPMLEMMSCNGIEVKYLLHPNIN